MKKQILTSLCFACVFSFGKPVLAQETLPTANDIKTATELETRGVADLQAGKVDDAIVSLKKAIEIYPKVSNARKNLAIAYQNKAIQYINKKEFKKAIQLLQESESLALREFGYKSKVMVSIINTYAVAYTKSGESDIAAEYEKRAAFLKAEVARKKTMRRKTTVSGNTGELENIINVLENRKNGGSRGNIQIKGIRDR